MGFQKGCEGTSFAIMPGLLTQKNMGLLQHWVQVSADLPFYASTTMHSHCRRNFNIQPGLETPNLLALVGQLNCVRQAMLLKLLFLGRGIAD